LSEGVSTIEEFLRKAGGPWLRAVHVKTGDRLKILSEPVVDDQTFDRPYLVCDVLLQRTNEEFKLRLSKTNVTRIAQTLGTSSWKGKEIEVISVEEYPGLKQRGILFKGVAPAPEQVKLPVAPTIVTPPTPPKPAVSAPAPVPAVSPEIVRSVKELISFYDEVSVERLQRYLTDKGFTGSIDDVIRACGLVKDERGFVKRA